MINRTQVLARGSVEFDFTDDTFPLRGVMPRFGTADITHDTDGVHQGNVTSTRAGLLAAGFSLAYEAELDVRYDSTEADAEDIGLVCDCQTFEDDSDLYYVARVDGGIAKLTTVVGDGVSSTTFTDVVQSPFVLPEGELCTIKCTRRGNIVVAEFTATTPEDVLIQGSVGAMGSGRGICGYRNFECTSTMRRFKYTELVP